jgi:membrane protein
MTASTRFETIRDALKEAAQAYGEDAAGHSAAALSFYTLFSLVPMLFLVVAIAGFLLGDVDRLNEVVDQVESAAGEVVADQIAELLDVAKRSAGTSLGIGIALTIFSASGIFLQVQGVLNGIFHVETERTKGLVGLLWKRGVAFVSAVVLAVFVVTPVGAVAGIQYVNRVLVPDDLGWLKVMLAWTVPLVSVGLLIVVVGLTFQTMTAVIIPWRAARRGGVITALVGLPAAYLVGLFLGEIGGSGTLGALGGIAILLFFFNLMWQVYLFGAELTKVYADSLVAGGGVAETAPPPATEPVGEASRVEPGLAGAFGLLLGFVMGRRRG